jgi:integrase/recombinase XerD
VKQHLDALRMLFDWLVIGQVNQLNPVHAVHGPKYVVKKGKTSVLTVDEARELLDSISLVMNTGRRRKGQAEFPQPSVVGLRDRALIAVMIYSFARINAVLEMKVRDYFIRPAQLGASARERRQGTRGSLPSQFGNVPR